MKEEDPIRKWRESEIITTAVEYEGRAREFEAAIPLVAARGLMKAASCLTHALSAAVRNAEYCRKELDRRKAIEKAHEQSAILN